jgi:prevent-host-death family protein
LSLLSWTKPMSATYNMHDAKTHLSRLAERAAAGEEIVIARNGRPLARLMPLEQRRKPRRLGLWKGEVWIGDAFDDPLPADIQRHFEGALD